MKFPVLMVAPMLCFAAGSQAQLQVVSPQQAQASHDKFSPLTIDAGDYVYVSGQGPRRKDGSTPKNFADQVRQSLENVRSALEAAGLTMDHLVYVQVYLEDINQYGELANLSPIISRRFHPRARSWALPGSLNLPCKLPPLLSAI